MPQGVQRVLIMCEADAVNLTHVCMPANNAVACSNIYMNTITEHKVDTIM